MVSLLKEEILRIQKLMSIKEEQELGGYMDSTYLKTSDEAGISDEETDVIVFDKINDAIEHNIKLVMIRPEYVNSARKFIDR